nr:hypothetical protein [Nitrospirota bacterium]
MEGSKTARWAIAMLALASLTLSPWQAAAADPLDQELVTLVHLGELQGRAAEEMKRLTDQVQRAQSLGLPTESLVDKIKEGMAKGIETPRIEQRLILMINHMKLAKTLLKATGPSGKNQAALGGKDRALAVLSEALERGVTPDEVRSVHRDIGEGNHEVHPDALAYGAKGMALMKEGGLPPDESRALTATALRKGVEPTNLMDLARELKGRGPEFREHPAKLRDIQNAVERGHRMEKIIGDLRSRPDTTKPQ